MSNLKFNVNWDILCYNCRSPLNVYVTFNSIEVYTLFLLYTFAFKLDLTVNVIRRKYNGKK